LARILSNARHLSKIGVRPIGAPADAYE